MRPGCGEGRASALMTTQAEKTGSHMSPETCTPLRAVLSRTPRRPVSSPTRRQLLVALAAGWASPAATADEALLRELRAGAVLLMRHTQTVVGVGDPTGWRLEQCATQ